MTVEVREGERSDVRPVRLRVHRGQPLHPRRPGRGDPHGGRAGPAHRRLQDGPVPARRSDHRPRASPGWPRRASTSSSPTRPTPRSPASPPPSASSRRRSSRCSAPRPGGSSSPASPATCTASSRSWTPRATTAARSPSSAARWSATWASPATWATSTIPDGLVVDLKQLEKLPANKITLICTGSQGEPMAALSRMANRDHTIRITEGDTVLLASSLIPGNENAIYRVINELTRWGATSSTRATPRCTSPGTPAPASSSTATTSSSPPTCCPCTGSGATCGPTPTSPSAPASTPTGRHRRGRRRSSTSSTASPRSPARSPRAWCTSTR